MPDFEPMPIGTRAAIKEAAELFRSYEGHHREEALNLNPGGSGRSMSPKVLARQDKAERNRLAAEKLEALLVADAVQDALRDGRLASEAEERAHNGGFTIAESEAVGFEPPPQDEAFGREIQIAENRILKRTEGLEGTATVPSDSAWQPPLEGY